MVANDKTQIVRRKASLLMGTAGQVAATAVGFITKENGIVVTVQKNNEPLTVQEYDGSAEIFQDISGAMVTATLAQFNTDALGWATGVAASGNTVTLGGSSPTYPGQYSCKVIGTRDDGETVTTSILYCRSTGETELTFNRGTMTGVPLELTALDNDTAMATITVGTSSFSATISSGSLARPAGGYVLVTGEGSAADALTAITGATTLVDGEYLRLQIASASAAITVTHGEGAIELIGDTDFVMNDLNDFLDLQYDLDNTKWIEAGRYQARTSVI